jgi:diguanylate cyclase (GGDEF)-like protein/PAS domain S-box-containing protein
MSSQVTSAVGMPPFEDASLRTSQEWRQTLLEYQAIFENAWVGIVFTRDRKLLHCNPRFSELFGWRHGELLGQPGRVVYPSDAAYADVGRVAGPILAAGKVFETDRLMCRKDGSTFMAHVFAKAINPADTTAGTIWIVEDVTERHDAEARLQRLFLEQQAIFENASVSIVFTRDGTIAQCNPRAEAMYGWPPGTLTGQPASVFFSDADDYARFSAIAGPVLSSDKLLDLEWLNARKDGSTFWSRNRAKAIDAGNGSRSTIWITEDISTRKETEESLRKIYTRQRAILDNASVGILFTSAGIIVDCNPRMEDIFGWLRGTLAGQPAQVFFADAEEYARFGEAARAALAAGELLDLEWQNLRKDGTRLWCRHLARGIDLGNGQLSTVWITEDISQRKTAEAALRRAHDEMELRVHERTIELAAANALLRAEVDERLQAEERVRHMANHDALTGLPNRRLLHDRLHQAIALAHRHRQKVAVMFIDLDRFKTINDTLGHATGDLLLQEAGKRISAELREGDTVARLGGDEFVIVLPELDDANSAAIIAQKLSAIFSAAFPVAGNELHVTPSIGIAIYPDDGVDPETLTRNADTAMYHAKDAGRDNHKFFTEQMNIAAAERFALENSLHNALARNELLLHYQPRIAIDSRRASGFEALLRWRHPEQGMISPASFIPVAEETGLIVPIGEWVLRTACRQHVAWRTAGHAPLPVAVNLSPRQFRQRNLVEVVARALDEAGMEARYLELEITEGSLMQATEHTLATLESLNALGVRLSIDDFGVGYSSLSYLKRFPVDQLKIDQSFVRDIATDADDAAIVSAIIGLARNLSLDVVAEGVETEEQLAFISACGCTEAQGFYFSRPLPAEEVAARFLAAPAADAGPR